MFEFGFDAICRTCVHWQPPIGKDIWGRCERDDAEEGTRAVMSGEGIHYTQAQHFCSQWKLKEEALNG